MRGAWLGGLMALMVGCTPRGGPPASNLPDAALPKDAAPVDAAPKGARKRKPKREKIPLPPPQPLPPRPAGEPANPEDFDSLSQAAASGAPVKKPGAPPVQRIDAFRFRVGRVEVDRAKRTVEIPAKVNMVEGILEYVAVSSDGKLHESILELDAEPSHLHLGLLLLDMDPAKVDRSDPMKPSVIVTPGGKVKLEVAWTDKDTGKSYQQPVETWLYDRKTKKAPPLQAWSFLGSHFWEGRFVADVERSVVGLVPDESVVITIGADAGNPYQGEMQGFEVFTKKIPPKGTPVRFLIIAADGKPLPTVPPVPPKPEAP